MLEIKTEKLKWTETIWVHCESVFKSKWENNEMDLLCFMFVHVSAKLLLENYFFSLIMKNEHNTTAGIRL